jgi:hypothetical protein
MVDSQTATVIIGAAEFLVGSVLVCLGILVISATAVILNRLFTRYWTPIKLFNYVQPPPVEVKTPDTKS